MSKRVLRISYVCGNCGYAVYEQDSKCFACDECLEDEVSS